MKKIVSVILAVAMLMISSVCFAEAATLRAGTNPEFPPFEYVGDTGEIEGIDVDILNEVAKDLGMTMTMEAMDFDALVPSLVSGKLDVVIAGMTITEERKQSVLFSDPYFTATQVVILPEGSAIATQDDLKGKKVGVQMGTTGDLMISEPKYEVASVERYTKGMDAALDLKNGRLDAVVIDTLPAQQFVAALGGLTINDGIFTELEAEAYGIAVPMGQDELIAKINASIARMKEDGTYDAILLKYAAAEEEAADATEAPAEEGAEATEAPAEEGAEATEAPAEN